VVSFTIRSFYPEGKIPRHTLDRKLGGSQDRSGRGGEEKNSQPLLGLEPRAGYKPAISDRMPATLQGRSVCRDITFIHLKISSYSILK